MSTFLRKLRESLHPKVLWQNDWIAIWQQGSYTYLHENRGNGQLVACLGFRETNGRYEFVGRFERTIPHGDNIKLTALTGGCESSDTQQDAIREFKEEAGIDIGADRLISLGPVFVSKAADTVCHLYAVDCNGLEIGEALGDGSEGEMDAYSQWVTEEDICESTCPLLAAMYLRWLKA